jgi:MATE family multidrug resistance protein
MKDSTCQLDDPNAPAPGSLRELLPVAVPMVLSSASEMLMIFTDRAFLSHYSRPLMNASMGGGLASFLSMTFFLGVIGYGTALVAQYFGSGQHKKCSVVVSQSVLLCIASYPILVFGIRPLVLSIFSKTQIAPEQIGPQCEYYNILIFWTFIPLLRSAMGCFFTGIGRTRIVLITSLAGVLINIPANYVLIYGKLGFPAMGIQGAAYGTILGGAISLIVMVCFYLRREFRVEFGTSRPVRFCRDVMGRLLRYGYPAGMEMFMNLAAFNLMVGMYHAYSEVASTGVTLMFNYEMLVFVPLMGLQIGVISMVGRYMGKGLPDIAHKVTMSGAKAGLLYSGVVMLIFGLTPQYLVELFRADTPDAVFDEAVPLAIFLLRMVVVYMAIDALIVVFGGALRGAGDTLAAMCISVFVHLVGLPVAYLGLYRWGWSVEKTWIAMTTVFFCSASLIFWRYRSGKWRSIRVIDTDAALATAHDLEFHEHAEM